MRSTLISLISLVCAATPAIARTYNIRNWCPGSINLYLDGKLLQQDFPSEGRLSLNLTDDEGFFYTDTNRISNESNGTRVAFKLEKPYGYYYIVADPNNFNVGISIQPDSAGSSPTGPPDNRCLGIEILSPGGDPDAPNGTAFMDNVGPTNLTSYPTDVAPPPPLYSCLDETTSYTVTFCPAELWPQSSSTIHPNGNSEYCLDVQGAVFENGTPVQVYKCNGTPAQIWDLHTGSTRLRVQTTDFCLDAGSQPGNGVGMKIWKCYDNIPVQEWYLTADNRIALKDQGLCLDLTDGKLADGTVLQTWKCTDNDTNQIWVPTLV